MTTYAVRRVLTALLLVAAPGLVLGSAPAAGAATCASSGGVSVVVDYRELGGSMVTACAPDGGGKSATAVFASVGVSLTYATRQPGFVRKEVWVPSDRPDTVVIMVWWESRELWKTITDAQVAAVDHEMGDWYRAPEVREYEVVR